MKYARLSLIFLIPLSCFGQKEFDYPKAGKVDSTNTYFGTVISDPYRWLEDLNSEKTTEWVTREEKITSDYEKSKASLLNGINEKLRLYSSADFKSLIRLGKYYFQFTTYDAERPAVLSFQKTIGGDGTVIVDPADYSNGKNEVFSIRDFSLSSDSRFLAFSLAKYGSDLCDLHLVDLEKQEPLPDVIHNVKFAGMSWKDHGFFYIRRDSVDPEKSYTAIDKNLKLCFHEIGQDPSKDRVVFTPPGKVRNKWFHYMVTHDEKYLVVDNYMAKDTGTLRKAVFYATLDKISSLDFHPMIVVPGYDSCEFDVIDNIGDKFLVKTDLNAPTKRLLLYDPAAGINQFNVVVRPFKNILQKASISKDRIILLYYLDGQYLAQVCNLEGKVLKQIKFPVGCSVKGFDATSSDEETFYFVSSFYHPSLAHRLDLKTLKTELISNTYVAFDQEKFETVYVKYKSFDSTEVPMFLTFRKGLKLKDRNPTLLYAYGGFGVSLTPFFNPGTLVWIENGGIFAVPGIRGGGEQGSAWHHEGRRLKRMNAFNDFLAAANYLIDSNYTTSKKLAIEGGSNGGLLVAVAMTKNPELFKAVVAKMGVYDMLRYNKFTVSSAWASEYGTSSIKNDFPNLINYSPLHNLKPGVKYPATLAITADHDDRVPPLHTYKFMATLQEFGDPANPYLLKVVHGGGHYGSTNLKQKLETEALKYLFLFRNLNVDPASVY